MYIDIAVIKSMEPAMSDVASDANISWKRVVPALASRDCMVGPKAKVTTSSEVRTKALYTKFKFHGGQEPTNKVTSACG